MNRTKRRRKRKRSSSSNSSSNTATEQEEEIHVQKTLKLRSQTWVFISLSALVGRRIKTGRALITRPPHSLRQRLLHRPTMSREHIYMEGGG